MNPLTAQIPGSLQSPAFYIRDDFFESPETLRSQFEQKILTSAETENGTTPLSYAFCPDAYQFLTAGAERFFTPETIEHLIQNLLVLGADLLELSHVSTPQLRVYIEGCSRRLLRDDVSAPWRYSLSLTHPRRNRKDGRLRILTEDADNPRRLTWRTHRTVNACLTFNQIVVHRTTNPYSIDPPGAAATPLEGAVFLDGYLW